ncbi:MAG: hypothetical protein CMP72_02095, partial [Flavobacteriales bacterium]|nr:hypothetical protein [Flavobacteriales bacterium]
MSEKERYEELLFVSIEEQKMYRIESKKITHIYDISTSKYGVGNKKNSNKTPLGLHIIKEKHGDNVPINGRMVGRVFYGHI